MNLPNAEGLKGSETADRTDNNTLPYVPRNCYRQEVCLRVEN